MKFDHIELYHVSMPLIEPWRTAYGQDLAIESVVVRSICGDRQAWSETAPFAAPCYSPEWAAGTFDVLKRWLAPAVVGMEIEDAADLARRLNVFKGNPFARAALDEAWHIHAAMEAGLPLHRHLGATRDRVDVGADFGVADTIDALLASIDEAVKKGFKRVKLKFRPGWDLDMVAAVRRTFPDLTMHVDCNSAFTLDALDLFRKLDEYDLAMIEQPLAHDDLIDHAELARSVGTPICLDESIVSIERARHAIRLKSCSWINIKPGRVGGLTSAVEIHDFCRDAGVGCWVGGMLESAIGAAICIALAMLDNFIYPADIFPTSRFYAEDLADPPTLLDLSTGGPQCVAPPTAGLAPRPVPERLEACTLQRAVVTRGAKSSY